MTKSEDLGYLAKEIVPKSFIGRAPGVARDLVGAGEWEEGLCVASGDVALEGKIEGALWPT